MRVLEWSFVFALKSHGKIIYENREVGSHMSHVMHYGRLGSRIFLRHRHGVFKLMLSAIRRHEIRGIIDLPRRCEVS